MLVGMYFYKDAIIANDLIFTSIYIIKEVFTKYRLVMKEPIIDLDQLVF